MRASADGVVIAHADIGDHLEEGQSVAEIRRHVILPSRTDVLAARTVSEAKDLLSTEQDSSPSAQSDMEIVSPFKGVLSGLIHSGRHVPKDLKIGDVDPRDDAALCHLVSDKALAIGGVCWRQF